MYHYHTTYFDTFNLGVNSIRYQIKLLTIRTIYAEYVQSYNSFEAEWRIYASAN